MATLIHGYQRRLPSGKLVTVASYQADRRNAVEPEVGKQAYVISHVDSPLRAAMGIANTGVYPPPDNSSTAGITSVQYFRVGLIHRTGPIVRFRRSLIPLHGAYQIPKKIRTVEGRYE